MCAYRNNNSKADSHRWAQENLSAYVDSELAESDVQRIEAHLSGCGACSDDLQTLRHTVELLRQLPERPIPRSFTIPERQRQPTGFWLDSLFPYFRAGAVAAAALLLAVISADLFQGAFTFSRVSMAPAIGEHSQVESVAMSPLGFEEAAGSEAAPTESTSAADTAVLEMLTEEQNPRNEQIEGEAESKLLPQRMSQENEAGIDGREAQLPTGTGAPEPDQGAPMMATVPQTQGTSAGGAEGHSRAPSLASPAPLATRPRRIVVSIEPGNDEALSAETTAETGGRANAFAPPAPDAPPVSSALQDAVAASETVTMSTAEERRPTTATSKEEPAIAVPTPTVVPLLSRAEPIPTFSEETSAPDVQPHGPQMMTWSPCM